MLIYKIVSCRLYLLALTCLFCLFFLIEEQIHFDAFPQIIHKKAPEITSGNNSM